MVTGDTYSKRSGLLRLSRSDLLKIIENEEEQRVQTPDISLMTVVKCAHQCKEFRDKEKGNAHFFLLKKGTQCTCLSYVDKSHRDEGAQNNDTCRGIIVTSVAPEG